MSKHNCAVCGKLFDGERNSRYCSKECIAEAKREAHKRLLKERGGLNMGDIITCPTCGKNFQYSSSRKRYCSVECQRKAQRTKTGEKTLPRPRKKRAKTMAEIARAAREEHMSYGEYVNKYRL